MNLTNCIKPYNKSKNKNFKSSTTIQLPNCWEEDKPLKQVNYQRYSQLFIENVIDEGNDSNQIHDRYLS